MEDCTAYVFKPLKQRLTVLGLGGREALLVLATAAIGALLAWTLGGWTHPVAVPVSQTEQTDRLAALQDERAAAQRADAAAADEAQGKQPSVRAGDEQLLAAAAADGVSAASTDEELATKVESQSIEQLPVIPDVPRWMVLFFGSTLLMAGIQAEAMHNTSIWREARRLARNALAQHDFPSDREGWMERHEKKGARR